MAEATAVAQRRFCEPEQAALVDGASVLCPLYDSLFLVGSARGGAGRVVVLDTHEPRSTVPLLELEEGCAVACIAAVAPPPARAFTLLAIVQRSSTGGADRLLVYQLAFVSAVEQTGASWRSIPICSAELGVRAEGLQLSHDGRFAAVLGTAAPPAEGGGAAGARGVVQVFGLPEAAVVETLAQAEQLVAAGSGPLDAPLVLEVSPPPPLSGLEGAAAELLAAGVPLVSCHWLTAPRHRSLNEPLVLACAGLCVWGAGSEALHAYQLLAHRPPAQAQPVQPDRCIALHPAQLSASCLDGSSTLLALGYADGCLALLDPHLHVQRAELAPHGARVVQVALHGRRRLLSLDASGCVRLHELGGKQAAEARLALALPPLTAAPQLGWGALCACLPLCAALRSDGSELRLVGTAGETVGRVLPPAGLRFAAGGPGGSGPVCRLLNDEHLLLLATHAPQPSAEERAPASEAGAEDAPAAEPAETAEAAGAAGGGAPAAEASAAEAGGGVLLLVDLSEALLCFYPGLRSQLGADATAAQLEQVRGRGRTAAYAPGGMRALRLTARPPNPLRLACVRAQVLLTYSHEQLSQGAAVAHPLLLGAGAQPAESERGGGGTGARTALGGERSRGPAPCEVSPPHRPQPCSAPNRAPRHTQPRSRARVSARAPRRLQTLARSRAGRKPCPPAPACAGARRRPRLRTPSRRRRRASARPRRPRARPPRPPPSPRPSAGPRPVPRRAGRGAAAPRRPARPARAS